jgi:hypothetical protein
MQKPWLFRFLKSVNPIIFFSVGILSVGVLGYICHQIYRDLFRERVVSNVVNSGSQKQGVKTKMSLGNFAPIEGTPYYFAPISSEQNYRQDYYDKTADSVRNYLFLNSQDKSVGRLISKNHALLLNTEKLGQQDQKGGWVKVKALLYQVVETDTNKDDRFTENDHKTIALSEVSGKNYTALIQGVDRVLGSFQTTPSTLTLVYAADKKNLVAEINLVNRQVVSTQELPSIDD